jgi:prepilin-type N-terminal cleavage/methylation domain-containing protein
MSLSPACECLSTKKTGIIHYGKTIDFSLISRSNKYKGAGPVCHKGKGLKSVIAMRKTLFYRPISSKNKGFKVQGSRFSRQWAVDSGQWAVGSRRRNSTDDFPRPSPLAPRPSPLAPRPSPLAPHPSGFTLVEVIVAVVLMLILMGAVIQMFSSLGQSITDSRSVLEASERLNSAVARLQMDLKGVTVKMLPPRNPEDGEGYFEYIEGPVPPQQYIQGSVYNAPYDWDNNPFESLGVAPKPVNTDNGKTDSTVSDFDDILMFTTRSTGRQFVGLVDKTVFKTPVAQSDVAEVVWFVRGRTLYRRQLLVNPGLWKNLSALPPSSRFYENNDVSVRVQNGQVVPNTLSDLTRRECRYAHPTDVFPFDVRRWGLLGLPTLRESATWNLANPPIPPTISNPSPLNPYYPSAYFFPNNFNPPFVPPLDFWTNDSSHRLPDPYAGLVQGFPTTRIADDVILTNVIGFDVKAWEPALGQYVDLGYEMRPIDPSNPTKLQEIKHCPPELTPQDNPYVPGEMFYHRGYCPLDAPQKGYLAYILGCYQSTTGIIYYTPRVYDTWSTHYESVGLSGLNTSVYPPGRGVNGFDDPGRSGVANGIIDDEDEKITSPPYPVPLRGIQVKIRIFEPDSRQIREVTIVQDFLPK